MKAIETEYSGVLFRSRTEARWALFFDRLDVAWKYEHEGYDLPSGRYLPDFYLPKYRQFVEVKGQEPTQHELRLCEELSKSVACGKMYLFVGEPADFYGYEIWFEWEGRIQVQKAVPTLCFRCLNGKTFSITTMSGWSCCDDCWNANGVAAPEEIDEHPGSMRSAWQRVHDAAGAARTHRFWNPHGVR